MPKPKPKAKKLSPRAIRGWAFIISVIIAWLLYQLPFIGHS